MPIDCCQDSLPGGVVFMMIDVSSKIRKNHSANADFFQLRSNKSLNRFNMRKMKLANARIQPRRSAPIEGARFAEYCRAQPIIYVLFFKNRFLQTAKPATEEAQEAWLLALLGLVTAYEFALVSTIDDRNGINLDQIVGG
jgi:hypothetical protein